MGRKGSVENESTTGPNGQTMTAEEAKVSLSSLCRQLSVLWSSEAGQPTAEAVPRANSDPVKSGVALQVDHRDSI